jgi:hypothetical protein
VAERKPFLLRMDGNVLEALQRWARDDLRSVNGQIEFVLRRGLAQAGRAPARKVESPDKKEGPARRTGRGPLER